MHGTLYVMAVDGRHAIVTEDISDRYSGEAAVHSWSLEA